MIYTGEEDFWTPMSSATPAEMQWKRDMFQADTNPGTALGGVRIASPPAWDNNASRSLRTSRNTLSTLTEISETSSSKAFLYECTSWKGLCHAIGNDGLAFLNGYPWMRRVLLGKYVGVDGKPDRGRIQKVYRTVSARSSIMTLILFFLALLEATLIPIYVPEAGPLTIISIDLVVAGCLGAAAAFVLGTLLSETNYNDPFRHLNTRMPTEMRNNVHQQGLDIYSYLLNEKRMGNPFSSSGDDPSHHTLSSFEQAMDSFSSIDMDQTMDQIIIGSLPSAPPFLLKKKQSMSSMESVSVKERTRYEVILPILIVSMLVSVASAITLTSLSRTVQMNPPPVPIMTWWDRILSFIVMLFDPSADHRDVSVSTANGADKIVHLREMAIVRAFATSLVLAWRIFMSCVMEFGSILIEGNFVTERADWKEPPRIRSDIPQGKASFMEPNIKSTPRKLAADNFIRSVLENAGGHYYERL